MLNFGKSTMVLLICPIFRACEKILKYRKKQFFFLPMLIISLNFIELFTTFYLGFKKYITRSKAWQFFPKPSQEQS